MRLQTETQAYVVLKKTLQQEIEQLTQYSNDIIKDDTKSNEYKVKVVYNNQVEIEKLQKSLSLLEQTILPLIELGYIKKYI